MKKLFLFLFGGFVLLFSFGCSDNSNPSETEEMSLNKTSVNINLTSAEIEGLIHMRIEEKLARDVYITLGKKWNARVFLNIQESEQNHMNAIKRLLDKFGIQDPLKTDDVGIFPNETFQKLYDELFAKGSLSLSDAFKAGIRIEELDIADLENQINNIVENPSIKNVYTNLQYASENHLNAFKRNLNMVKPLSTN